MGRPRKVPEIVPVVHDDKDWKLCYAAAIAGLASRGGMAVDIVAKTAVQYADAAVIQIESRHGTTPVHHQ